MTLRLVACCFWVFGLFFGFCTYMACIHNKAAAFHFLALTIDSVVIGAILFLLSCWPGVREWIEDNWL